MKNPDKMAFVFGDITLTFSPADIEIIWKEWDAAHPGKNARRDMTSEEFGHACVERMKANARLTRTVLHN